MIYKLLDMYVHTLSGAHMKKEKTIINALVVDDNEVNTMILANMLELFQIHADQADNGMKAVLLSRKIAYDIIFIDHIMPEMDGVQTTAAIRHLAENHYQPVIIALTSNITEQIRIKYGAAGVNDVYAKPLSLVDLISVLKKWCPRANVEGITIPDQKPESNQNNELILSLIESMDDIDYKVGLRYALGNQAHYIHILEVSLKDIQSCYNIIINSYENNSFDQLRIAVHNLKSVFSNIGALGLSAEAACFEKIIMNAELNSIEIKYSVFVKYLETFQDKLKNILEQYELSVLKESNTNKQVYIPMTKEEYEQSLLSTIYYIKRFEYDLIMKELEELMLRGRPELKQEYELAYADIKEFKYENALARILLFLGRGEAR